MIWFSSRRDRLIFRKLDGRNKRKSPFCCVLVGVGCRSRVVKILIIFADILNRRRNDIIVKFLVLSISIIYATLLMVYYNS